MILTELIEFASAQAEKIFRTTGVIYPMWHAIKANGEQLIMRHPDIPEKDLAVALVKVQFELEDVVTYVFISEAWILHTTEERDPVIPTSLEFHPDRREAIMFSAGDDKGQEQTARRYILRPEHGKAKLAPLIMDDMTNLSSSGRMVGLLRKK